MTDINKLEQLAKAASQNWTMRGGDVRVELHAYRTCQLWAETSENHEYLYAVRPSEIQALISQYRRMEEALRKLHGLLCARECNPHPYGSITARLPAGGLEAERLAEEAQDIVHAALQDQDQ